MKRIMYAAFLMLPGIFFAQTKPKVPIDDNGIGKQFPDCMLNGSVCSLFVTPPNPGAITNAYKEDGRTFYIELTKSAMSADKQRAVIGKLFSEVAHGEILSFKMAIDYTVENSFMAALDLDRSAAIIKKGDYPVTINDKNVLIKITLTN